MTNDIIVKPVASKNTIIDEKRQLITLIDNQDTIRFKVISGSVKPETKLKSVWYLLGTKNPSFAEEDSVISYSDNYSQHIYKSLTIKGYKKPEIQLNFSSFYAGGVMGYFELFASGNALTNQIPQGWFVRRITSPKILGVEWRSYSEGTAMAKYPYPVSTHGWGSKEVKEPIGFNSWVQLHIYTYGLYGKQLRVKLYDEVFWLWKGKELEPQKSNTLLFPRKNIYHLTESKGMLFHCKTQLERSVTQFTDKLPEHPKLLLVKVINNKKNERIDRLKNDAPKEYIKVQSAVVDVFIPSHFRNYFNTDNINLKPEIEYYDDETQEWKSIEHHKPELKVSASALQLPDKPTQGISPQVVNKYETNKDAFQPCKFTKIEAHIDNIENPITYFSQEEAIDHTDVPLQIVAGETPINISIDLAEVKTGDCFYEGKEKDHTNKVITFHSNQKQKYHSTDNQISWSQNFPEPAKGIILDNILLSHIKPIKHQIQFNTCRYQKTMDIEVYPKIAYELAFKYMCENPFFTKQTKAYTKKKYLKSKGIFGKEGYKNQKKQRKKAYKQEVKDIRGGYLAYDSFEVSLEYSYDDKKQEALTGFGDLPIFRAIDSAMWVINKINELTFDKEAKEAEEELGIFNEDLENLSKEEKKKKKEKKKEWQKKADKKKADTQKKLKKRKKKRSKLGGKLGKKINKTLPLRIEVTQPVFAGAVTWEHKNSTQYPTQVGTNYAIKLKADPLISIKGSLDLLFVATKIPYVGQGILAITSTADAVGVADDYWNTIIDALGFGDEYKINLELDYYLDLYVSGDIKLEATTAQYHTIDGFDGGDLKVTSDIECGIECGGSFVAEFGKVKSINATINGKAYAKFKLPYEADKKYLGLEYEGLYAIVEIKYENEDNEAVKGEPDKGDAPQKKSFKLHDGFSYEIKLDD